MPREGGGLGTPQNMCSKYVLGFSYPVVGCVPALGVLELLCRLLFGGPSPCPPKVGSVPQHFMTRGPPTALCRVGTAARWPIAKRIGFSWPAHTRLSEEGTRFLKTAWEPGSRGESFRVLALRAPWLTCILVGDSPALHLFVDHRPLGLGSLAK